MLYGRYAMFCFIREISIFKQSKLKKTVEQMVRKEGKIRKLKNVSSFQKSETSWDIYYLTAVFLTV